jgi:hypothetical protein
MSYFFRRSPICRPTKFFCATHIWVLLRKSQHYNGAIGNLAFTVCDLQKYLICHKRANRKKDTLYGKRISWPWCPWTFRPWKIVEAEWRGHRKPDCPTVDSNIQQVNIIGISQFRLLFGFFLLHTDRVPFQLLDSAALAPMKGKLGWRGANSISKFAHHNINGGAVDNTLRHL